MRAHTDSRQDDGAARPAGSRWSRIGWFVALWAMSVTVLGIVAFGIRLFLV